MLNSEQKATENHDEQQPGLDLARYMLSLCGHRLHAVLVHAVVLSSTTIL